MFTTSLWPHGMLAYAAEYTVEGEKMPQITLLCAKHGARGVTKDGGCHGCQHERKTGEYIEPLFPDNWERYVPTEAPMR